MLLKVLMVVLGVWKFVMLFLLSMCCVFSIEVLFI